MRWICLSAILTMSFLGCRTAQRESLVEPRGPIYSLIVSQQSRLQSPLSDSYEKGAALLGMGTGRVEAQYVFKTYGTTFLVPNDRILILGVQPEDEKAIYHLIKMKAVKLTKVPGTAHNDYARPSAYYFAVGNFMADFNKEMYKMQSAAK